jgi:hypothetical protein
VSKTGLSRASGCAFFVISVVAVAASAFVIFSPYRFRATVGNSRPSSFASGFDDAPITMPSRMNPAVRNLPLAFEQNKGQTDAAVSYLARTRGYTLFLTGNEAVFSLHPASGSKSAQKAPEYRINNRPSMSSRVAARAPWNETTAVVRMRLAGSCPVLRIAPDDRLPGSANYFIGNDPGKWQSDVPRFGRVSYQDVYPGVKLAFHGTERQMEFDFIVAPGADARPIDLQFNGAQSIRTDDAGNLVIASAAGAVLLHKPVAYQKRDGTSGPISAGFVLEGNNRVGFELGAYDHSRELVIDPSVSYAYSTYLGGSLEDDGYGIAVDSSGNAYVTGRTSSVDFPIKGGVGSNTNQGGFDVFVSKIAADGSSLLYSTYVGGGGDDSGNAIAVDALGDAFIAGGTASSDFPVTAGVFQPALGASATGNAFIFKLNPGGTALTYSTYLGGTISDEALGIAVDSSGNAYVAGKTTSSDFPVFPVASPLQPYITGSASSGFVSKLNSTGTALTFSTYIGGGSGDAADAIAIDSADNVYITGETFSSNFHVTTGAFQTTCGSCASSFPDAFVTVINPAGNGYIYSTFLGGSGADGADAIAVDVADNAYITGFTESSDFPLKGAIQSTYGQATDAFVTKLNSTGSALVYSTYLGGSGFDAGGGIAVDGAGNAYITGQTSSTNFPAANATQSVFGGATDAFVTEINPAGSKFAFSTYLGGPANEDGSGLYGAIAVDNFGANIYVTGDTASLSGFPLQSPLQGANAGGSFDAFVVKYAQQTFSIGATTPAAVDAGSSAMSTVTLTSYNGYSLPVNLSCAVTGTGSPLPGCSGNAFSTNPVTPTSPKGAPTTLTITTTGPNSALIRPRRPLLALWLPIFSLCMVGTFFSLSGSLNKVLFILVMTSVFALLFMPACGGSGSSTGGGGGGGGSTGTPAGAYIITITGIDANETTRSITIPLTVN